jgi:hypothetical protein
MRFEECSFGSIRIDGVTYEHDVVIGTGAGALPVMEELKREAQRRNIKLIIRPTLEAIQELKEDPAATNAILHVTC